MKKVILFSLYVMSQGTVHAQDAVLTWVDNSKNENGFVMERTLSPNCSGGWEVVGYLGANQTSFIDIRIPAACYRVAAYNEQGLSAYSNIAQVPSTPESYTATAQDNLGTPTDYAIQTNGATTTSISSPQNARSIQSSEVPELHSTGRAQAKQEVPSGPSATEHSHVPAKLNTIARHTQFAKPNKIWSVQVFATPSMDIADKLLHQLKSQGHAVYVVQAEVKGKIYHRVRIGPFGARKEAERVRQSFSRDENYRDAYLISD